MDTTTRAALFDSLLTDTALEDRAADEAKLPAPSQPRAKGQAVRQALPASLPRVEHHHEVSETHCACGQAFKRIGEEVSEQLDCVPAQFFVLRHILGKYAWRVLPDDCSCPHAHADDRQRHPGPRAAGPGGGGQTRRPPAAVPPRRDLRQIGRAYLDVCIARSSMAQWIGICGVRLAPLAQALKACVLGHPVIQAEEAPMRRRWHSWRRGGVRPKKAYVWVYRTTNFVAQRAVLFDFCASRGG